MHFFLVLLVAFNILKLSISQCTGDYCLTASPQWKATYQFVSNLEKHIGNLKVELSRIKTDLRKQVVNEGRGQKGEKGDTGQQGPVGLPGERGPPGFSSSSSVIQEPSVAVRLAGGDTSSSGRVEVYYEGQWGTICNEGNLLDNARVYCRTLGFRTNQFKYLGNAYGAGNGTILLLLQCLGDEQRLTDCAHHGWKNVAECTWRKVVSVDCGPAVRLVGGERESHGRVEVFHNNQWGTACNDGFDAEEAVVLCRMMGYSRSAVIPNKFGRGSGPIWLDEMQCTGEEDDITKCPTYIRTWGDHNCFHDEDVAIDCDP